jgi:hypothetical protein
MVVPSDAAAWQGGAMIRARVTFVHGGRLMVLQKLSWYS